MSRRSIWHSAWLAIAVMSCQRSCSCGEPPLARLVDARGQIRRDYRGSERQWNAAPVGATFSFGDGLRTGEGAVAQLTVGRSGRLRVESDTIIRFLDHPEDSPQAAPGVEVAQGSAVLEAPESDLAIRTRNGTAVLKSGTKVQVRAGAQSDSYRVLLGDAAFTTADGKTVQVGAGHSIAVGIGLAVMDQHASAPKPPAPPPTVPATPPSTPADAGVVSDTETSQQPSGDVADAASADAQREASSDTQQLQPFGPARPPDLVVTAGESFRLYDPKPPSAVGFQVGDRCSGLSELRLGSAAAARGSGVLTAVMGPGRHAYSVRCLDGKPKGKRIARGVVRVLHSSGTRPLPKSAPRNAIELDGHRYRLMYQNLRPTIAVSWPKAPKAPSYTLTLERPDGTRSTFDTHTPKHLIKSAMLQDGTHVLRMQAADDKRSHSKATMVVIVFDPAAPTASLESPPAAGYSAGESIEVRGTALEDSKVSIDGVVIPLDQHQAFAHTLTLAPDRSAFAVRFKHASHGIRYYLRRASAR